MSLAEPRCTASLKLTRTLLRFFPTPRSTECITTLPTPKSLPTVGLIRVVLCQRVDSQLLLTLYSVQLWRSFARITTQTPNSLPTSMTGTCGSNHNSSYKQLLSQLPPDQSTLVYSPWLKPFWLELKPFLFELLSAHAREEGFFLWHLPFNHGR